MFISLLLAYVAVLHPAAKSPSSIASFSIQSSHLQQSSEEVDALQRAANGGDASAQLKLAQAYEDGNGVPKDVVQAAAWYRKAAEQGNAEAQNSLGVMYHVGEGVDENKRLAVEWYEKAARQRNANAMFNLGVAYYNGDGVQVDDDLSYAWFVLAEEAGNPQAVGAVARAESTLPRWQITDGYKKIAQLCDAGPDAPQNRAEAASWWLKAATRGDHEAQVAIANHFLEGRGVPQDFSRARYWCTRAAKDGNAAGQYCLGYIYQRGFGVPGNAKTARLWYEAAAKRANVASIRAMAEMDEAGEGAKADPVEAVAWYAMLAVVGDKDALERIIRLKSQMTRKQWKEVEKRLPHFSVDPKKLDELLQSAIH